MSGTSLAVWLLGAVGQASASASEAPAAGTVETLEYTVNEGDSCASIAKRFFGDSKRYDIIHQYNPGMGPTPHKLEAGRVLLLPRVATAKNSGPDAEVTVSRRRVEAKAANEDGWQLASIGLDLFRGWRVNTLPRAAAELTFRDTSVLELRENTLVIIYGSSQLSARRTTTEATLDRGALRSRLGELSGGATLKVETPTANTELVGGKALVTVDGGGTSRIANHGGGNASVSGKTRSKTRGKATKRVKVTSGMGSKVETGKSPTPPHRLPPAPLWAAGQATRFVSIPAAGATVEASWRPEPKAASYRIEVARNADGRDVVADAVAPRGVDRVELRGLPPGEYWMSVASIDGDAFEGAPGVALALRVIAGALVLPDGAALELAALADDATAAPASAPIAVPRGTTFRAPQGTQCAVGEAAPAATVTLADAGTHAVACTDADGTASARLPVEVLPWTIELSEGTAPSLALVVGEPHEFVFSLSAGNFALARLGAVATTEVQVSAPEQGPDGRWRVTLTAGLGATAGELVLSTADDLAVQRVAYTVAARTASSGARPPTADRLKWIERWTPERNMWELGVYGGLIAPSQSLELFEAQLDLVDQGFQPLRRIAPDFGARVAYFPLRVLGLEVEGGAMPSRTRSDDRATLFTARAHVIGRLGFSSVTPFLLAGAGIIGVSGDRAALGRDVDAAMHFGGGLEVFANRWVALRLDIRDVVTAKRGVRSGVTSSLEALLGLSFTLGRKHTELRPPGPRDDNSRPPASTSRPPHGPPQPPATTAPSASPLPSSTPVEAEPQAPADADADGITDVDDRCVTEAETVNGHQDQDGCPDTLPTALAEFAGVMEGIAFATGSDRIVDSSHETLDHAVGVMKEFPAIRVMVAGHTDDVGSRASNLDLSRRRAEAVRKYLIDAGIDAGRLETRGAGPDEPLGSNKTKAGRARNRRIEFKLLPS